jgi:hypothetical protein
MSRPTALTECPPQLPARVLGFARRIAGLPDVKAAIEANHDENRWWPTTVTDFRTRMAVAGWSTRVSYSMINTYAAVVAQTEAIGFDQLVGLADGEVSDLVRPLGLTTSRVGYLRSLSRFVDALDVDPLAADADVMIGRFAQDVTHASFKVSQCAVLYARGYHCGIIPVDSGMVSKLAPLLGLQLPSGPYAHERMRMLLEACVQQHADDYLDLIQQYGYAVTIPADAAPSWWLHLALIYFKRLYLNRPSPRLCTLRPICDEVIDCPHTDP